MDRKAQSALEYLMTYGWALIVIAIVIGVLILVTSGATGGVTCQSQSTGIVVDAQSVTGTTAGVSLLNATGKEISSISAVGENGFSGTGTVSSTAVNKNEKFTVQGITVTPTNGAINGARIVVSYTVSGLDANAIIVCNGAVQ